jgi:hypothetical protein
MKISGQARAVKVFAQNMIWDKKMATQRGILRRLFLVTVLTSGNQTQ